MGFILIVLGMIGLFCLGQRLFSTEHDRDDYITISIIGTIFGVGAGGLALLMFGVQEGQKFDPDTCTTWTTEKNIVSINRQSQTRGSFILGTGSLSSRTYYYAYVKTDDGYLLSKYWTRKSYIVETDDLPKVVAHHYSCPKPIYSFLLFDEYMYKHYGVKFTFHVPKDTILREFKL